MIYKHDSIIIYMFNNVWIILNSICWFYAEWLSTFLIFFHKTISKRWSNDQVQKDNQVSINSEKIMKRKIVQNLID